MNGAPPAPVESPTVAAARECLGLAIAVLILARDGRPVREVEIRQQVAETFHRHGLDRDPEPRW